MLDRPLIVDVCRRSGLIPLLDEEEAVSVAMYHLANTKVDPNRTDEEKKSYLTQAIRWKCAVMEGGTGMAAETRRALPIPVQLKMRGVECVELDRRDIVGRKRSEWVDLKGDFWRAIKEFTATYKDRATHKPFSNRDVEKIAKLFYLEERPVSEITFLMGLDPPGHVKGWTHGKKRVHEVLDLLQSKLRGTLSEYL